MIIMPNLLSSTQWHLLLLIICLTVNNDLHPKHFQFHEISVIYRMKPRIFIMKKLLIGIQCHHHATCTCIWTYTELTSNYSVAFFIISIKYHSKFKSKQIYVFLITKWKTRCHLNVIPQVATFGCFLAPLMLDRKIYLMLMWKGFQRSYSVLASHN